MNSFKQSNPQNEAGNQNLPIPQLGEMAGNTMGGIEWSGENSRNQYGINENQGEYKEFRQVKYTGTGTVPGINPKDYYNSVNIQPIGGQYGDFPRFDSARLSDGMNGRNNDIAINQGMRSTPEMIQMQNVSYLTTGSQYC